MSTISRYPSDLDNLLEELRSEIFANLNCLQIGKIESYNKSEQSVEVQIMVKRRINETKIISYPVLVDCPLFVLQGGGAFIDMPIKTGDFCLIFFNDRDIDNWWTAGNETEPNTRRKHSLSDGIALVGLNPKNSALSLDGDKVIINATGFPVALLGITFDMLGANESFIKGDSHKTALAVLTSSIAGIVPAGSSSANIASIQTAFATFASTLASMLSTTIKGE